MNSIPDDDPEENTPVQVDIYGVKLSATPLPPSETEEPLTVGSVGLAIWQSLLRMARDSVGLAADTFTSSRSFVRGLGNLPSSLAERVGRAHEIADASLASPATDIETAVEQFENEIAGLRAKGISAEVHRLRDGTLAVVIARPELADEGVLLAASALARLPNATQRASEHRDPTLSPEQLQHESIDHKQLSLPFQVKVELRKSGIETVFDLIEVSPEVVELVFARSPITAVQMRRHLIWQSLDLNEHARRRFTELLNSSDVSCLGLKPRAAEACKRLNLKTIGDLLETPIGQIAELKGIGTQTVANIQESLHSLNLPVNTAGSWPRVETHSHMPLFPDE